MLENHLRSMMDRVDELNQEAIKFNRFQVQVIRQQQDKHRFTLKRVSKAQIFSSKMRIVLL